MSGEAENKLSVVRAKPHLMGLLAGLFLSTGLVFSAVTVTRAWVKVSESQTITVTGSSRRSVQSDLIVWRGNFSADGATLLEARRKLQQDLTVVESFLRERKISDFVVSPIGIQELRITERDKEGNNFSRVTGYRLTHEVEVRSKEVERVSKLDQETTALIEKEILFTTSTPQYIYTKAGEAKVEMLAEASKDARSRADQIAVQGGREVEQMQSAKMGVFQITPVYSLQTSWDGMNDTTSLEKTITAVVSATFSMK